MVRSVKAFTPKIVLYLYTASRGSGDDEDGVEKRRRQHGDGRPRRRRAVNDHDDNFGGGARKEDTIGLFAKTMLMENGPLADAETRFVDGVTIRYEGSTGVMKVLDTNGSNNDDDNDGGRGRRSVGLDLPMEMEADGNMIAANHNHHRFAHHIGIARASIRGCLEIERNCCCDDDDDNADATTDAEAYPVVRKMIAHGQSYDAWVTID